MTSKEIKNTMKCLKLMCADLNDMHNDYDIPTGCEDSIREMIKEVIKDFNRSQTTWTASLNQNKEGWYIKYE